MCFPILFHSLHLAFALRDLEVCNSAEYFLKGIVINLSFFISNSKDEYLLKFIVHYFLLFLLVVYYFKVYFLFLFELHLSLCLL